MNLMSMQPKAQKLEEQSEHNSSVEIFQDNNYYMNHDQRKEVEMMNYNNIKRSKTKPNPK